jgi:transposase
MRKSRISWYKQERLIEHFVSGSTARCAAELIGVNKSTAAYYFQRLREILAYQCEQESHEVFDGEIELDESYFGGKRKGKRGRGAGGKVPVFGLLKRNGKVYTKIIPDASSATLMPIITRKITPDSIVYTDYWAGV